MHGVLVADSKEDNSRDQIVKLPQKPLHSADALSTPSSALIFQAFLKLLTKKGSQKIG